MGLFDFISKPKNDVKNTIYKKQPIEAISNKIF